MLRIFNRHIAEGFAAYPEEPVGEETIADLLRQAADSPPSRSRRRTAPFSGSGSSAPTPRTPRSHTAQSTIFLAPEHTGAGIGSAVLRHLEAGAREHAVTILLAHISSRIPGSLAFHAKHGFVECGRFPGIGYKWGEPFDVVWMVKTLTEDDRA